MALVAGLAAALLFPAGDEPGLVDRAFAEGEPLQCSVPIDASLVFDHSGSMAGTRLNNAQDAATGFVDFFAGSPVDTDLNPHQLALIGFADGVATTDDGLTTNAVAIRDDIDDYAASGTTNLAMALQLGQLQLENPPDSDAEPGDTNDYMVVFTDGSANQPQDLDLAGSSNDLWIDINDNGVRDSLDDFSIDYPGGSNSAIDFNVVNGLLQISTDGTSRRHALNVTDNSEGTFTDADLDEDDDYDFIADFAIQHPGVTPNFRIIDGTLYLDMDDDGDFEQEDVNDFTPGHTDELAVRRNGAMRETTDYSGDGVDVYAIYWATAVKRAGTFLYGISYDGGGDDAVMMQMMASPGGYFAGSPDDISDIFDEIANKICQINIAKTRTSAAVTNIGGSVHLTASR